jgi:hypothetical protein
MVGGDDSNLALSDLNDILHHPERHTAFERL